MVLTSALAACGSPRGDESGSQTGGESDASTASATDSRGESESASGASASGSSSGPGGSASDSQGSASTSPTSESESASASGSTTAGGSATSGSTTGQPTTGESTTGQPTASTEPISASDSDSGSDSDSDSDSASASASDSDSGDSDSDTGDSDSDSDTGDEPCEPPGGSAFEYLWIANSDQGTVSKINAFTATEVARYYTDPSQNPGVYPSRVSVSVDGRSVVVSNRLGRGTTKIAVNLEDCIDRNKNGVIDTSMNKGDIRPYLEEECILWTTQVIDPPFATGAGPRATAFGLPDYDPKTCKFENEKVWVGYLAGSGKAEMARLDSATGVIEDTVLLPNWPIVIDAPHGYGPYIAAMSPDGYVWTTGVYSRVVYRIDPETLEVTRYESPHADNHYGMAVSPAGRVWFANVTGQGGHAGVSYFEPKDESWGVIPGSSSHWFNGIAADGEGRVWVAILNGTFGCGLMQIDGDNLSVTQVHKFSPCNNPTGVGLDGNGMVWMIDFHSYLWKLNPNTLEKTLLSVPNKHYTYSDFTGVGLFGVGPG